MTATQQKIELTTGDDVVIPYWVVDEYGAPEDLSPAIYTAFKFAVRDKPKGTLAFPEKILAAGQIVVQSPTSAGLLHVILNSADTASYVVGGAKVELYAELEATKQGLIRTLATGPLILHQSIAGAGT